MKWLKKSFVSLLMLTAAFGAYAESLSADEMTKLLQSFLNNPTVLELQVQRYGLKGEKADAILDYLKDIADDRKFLRYIGLQMEQLGLTDEAAYKDGTVTPGYVAAIVMQLQEGLSLQGLKKADDETLDQQFRFVLRLSYYLSDQACRDYHIDGLSKSFLRESDSVARRLYADMSAAEVRELLDRNRRLTQLALDETVPNRKLTEIEQESAQRALERTIERGMLELSGQEMHRIATAMGNIEYASARDACDASLFLLHQILSMKGQAKARVLRSLIQ